MHKLTLIASLTLLALSFTVNAAEDKHWCKQAGREALETARQIFKEQTAACLATTTSNEEYVACVEAASEELNAAQKAADDLFKAC
jgi:hypothetical protein